MQLPINSANIGTFFVKVTFDIFNRQIIWDASQTTYNGAGISAVQGIAFSLVDQDGVILMSIDFTSPQLPSPATTSVYTYDASAINFAFLFQTYKITAAIKDGDGTVYTTVPVYKSICQPTSITESGYVPGTFQMLSDCVNNILTVKDLTLLVYENLTPFATTRAGILNYPTGTIAPVSFAFAPFTNNIIYTGQYLVACTTVATYNINDDVYVLVTYLTNQNFNVTCGNFLGDISCCLTELYQTYLKNCDNAIGQNALNKYNSVSPLILNATIKQMTGQDPSSDVSQIRKQLGCNCGSNSLGQNQLTPINPAVYSIVVTGINGSSVSSATAGSTQTFTVTSNIYQVTKGNTADLAYTITLDNSVSGITKYVLAFNYDVMAGYILTAIANDSTLLSQLNAMISATGVDLTGLNGGCVIDLSSINYFLSYKVPSGAATFTNVTINGTTNTPGSPFPVVNTNAIQSYLNGLGLGVFQVSFSNAPGGSYINILSNANPNTVNSIVITISGNPVTVPFQNTVNSLAAILQAIINYLCNLSDLQLALHNALSLCTFDYNGNIINTAYPAGTPQSGFNAGLAAAICNITSRINTLTGVTCASIKAIFNQYPNAVFDNTADWYMASVGGNCTQLSGHQQALALIDAVNRYTDVKAAWCAIDCTTPGTCPDVANNNANIVGSNIGIYGVTWASTPVATQTVTVRYRVSGTVTWVISTNALLIFPNGNISGTSPYQITGLAQGTMYDIWIQNNCGGNGFISQITTPTGTVFTRNYLLANQIYNVCAASPTTLYSNQPLGAGVTMYTNVGLTTPVTGFLFITNATGGEIFGLNTSTGLVGADTGLACNSGVAGTYILGNSTGSICGGTTITLYTNGAFGVGGILYVDSALTIPQTGSSFVVNNGTGVIYNLNSSTGAIGASTGLTCSITATIANHTTNGAISGFNNITGFPSQPVLAGQTINGTHGTFTAGIQVFFGAAATASTNLVLFKNFSIVQTIAISGGDGTTRTFSIQTYNVGDILEIIWN